MTAGMSVSGTQLLRDDDPFFPMGWNSVAGLYAPPTSIHIEYLAAFKQFILPQAPTCAAMQQWNSNTVRFQVIPNVLLNTDLDTTTGLTYSAEYISKLTRIVNIAVKAGFTVILCINDNLPPPAGDWDPGTKISLPSLLDTTTAWTTLANAFKSNPYVMFEIWNEVSMTTGQWTTATTGWQAVFNGLVSTIRGTGATNVCIVGGVSANLTFAGAPTALITDSDSNTMYAFHQYFTPTNNHTTISGYDTQWGWIPEGNYGPVIATEWYNIDPDLNGYNLNILSATASGGTAQLTFAPDAAPDVGSTLFVKLGNKAYNGTFDITASSTTTVSYALAGTHGTSTGYVTLGQSSVFLNYCDLRGIGVLGWVFDDFKNQNEMVHIRQPKNYLTEPWDWTPTYTGKVFKAWKAKKTKPRKNIIGQPPPPTLSVVSGGTIPHTTVCIYALAFSEGKHRSPLGGTAGVTISSSGTAQTVDISWHGFYTRKTTKVYIYKQDSNLIMSLLTVLPVSSSSPTTFADDGSLDTGEPYSVDDYTPSFSRDNFSMFTDSEPTPYSDSLLSFVSPS